MKLRTLLYMLLFNVPYILLANGNLTYSTIIDTISKPMVIRKAGQDGVDTYRIPGIIKTNKGTLIAVYDVRYQNAKDLPANIDVGMSRSLDAGKTWEPMKIIMDMGEPHQQNGIGDPSILYDPKQNRIWVAALWSKGNRSIAGSIGGISADSTGQWMLSYSDDEGAHWETPYSITPQIKNPFWKILFQGPGSGICMKNRTLVFPAQFWDSTKMPYATIVYSKDHGKTWHCEGVGAKSNTTESQVVELPDGTLMLNMRDNRGGYRSVVTTNDMGKTWTTHSTSFNTLIDPICQASLIQTKLFIKGKLRDVLVFSNPNDPIDRKNITLKISLDNGYTWPNELQYLIHSEESYGYSSLVPIDHYTIGILYEGVKEIYFSTVRLRK